jgi:hypothetical protein
MGSAGIDIWTCLTSLGRKMLLLVGARERKLAGRAPNFKKIKSLLLHVNTISKVCYYK